MVRISSDEGVADEIAEKFNAIENGGGGGFSLGETNIGGVVAGASVLNTLSSVMSQLVDTSQMEANKFAEIAEQKREEDEQDAASFGF